MKSTNAETVISRSKLSLFFASELVSLDLIDSVFQEMRNRHLYAIAPYYGLDTSLKSIDTLIRANFFSGDTSTFQIQDNETEEPVRIYRPLFISILDPIPTG
jgi:hypothetical protein